MRTPTKIWVCESCGDRWETVPELGDQRDAKGRILCRACSLFTSTPATDQAREET